LFFFFSSRRRHTRSKRDWSSDVCSSDLTIAFSFFIAVNRSLNCRTRETSSSIAGYNRLISSICPAKFRLNHSFFKSFHASRYFLRFACTSAFLSSLHSIFFFFKLANVSDWAKDCTSSQLRHFSITC